MAEYTKRDREAAREIHRLFRSSWWQDKPNFITWFFMRPTAMFIYNILIPYQIAYGLQAIVIKDFDAVPGHAYTLLLYAFLYAVLWGYGGIAVIRVGKKGIIYIQQKVFANYLEKDYEFLNNTYLGTLGAQAVRLRQALDEYNQILFNGFLKQIIVVVSSVAIIAYQSPLLAVVTITSVVCILSFTIAITRWRIRYRRVLSETNSETAGIISDSLGHGSTVKSYAAEDYEQKRLGASLQRLADAQAQSWLTSIPADVGRIILATIATFLMLIITSNLYENGSISIAIVILVQLYVIKLINSTQEIADLIKAYEATMSAAHQAVKTMLIKPTILDKEHTIKLPKKSQIEIELKAMSYRYDDSPKNVYAVRDFSFTIKPGERVGIIGYSGSGKTTLTKLLLRFMDVTKGSIQLNGIDIRDLSQKDLRSAIAYVPQEPLLFHRTIHENIAYGKPGTNNNAIRSAGKAAYVDEFVDELAKGYNTQVGEKGVKLSGGQRQRVAIARALLKDAPILVLDEATSALDSKSEQYIQKALWKLMKSRTAIVIAHRLSTIQRMDRIVVMDNGKIIEIGTHNELLERSGIYAKLWEHQSGGYIVDPGKQNKK